MNISCSAEPCPVILDCSCVFYSGANLIYTGIVTNDTLCAALIKIDNKFKDAAIGYVFQNGIIQAVPGGPVKLGGTLTQDTVITSGPYTFTLTGTIESTAFITTGGTSSQFVKADGSLDSTVYQPAGNYITALTGDGSASGPGSATFTLSPSGVIANTYGSATQVPVITVDAKGRVTNVTNTAISYPSQLLLFSGDVSGAGTTGANVTLTLATVNSNVYATNTFLKFAVNGKGLVTSATPVVSSDIITALGYTPVPNTRTITINGVTQDLSANRTWTIAAGTGTVTSVSVISGTGILASITNPTTTPAITITNTKPDQIVALTPGTGISISGTYPNFTISATGSGTVTAVTATSPLSSTGGTTPDISIQQASGSQAGYLSSTDWTTFNSKQDAITLTTTGTSGAATFIANTLNIPQYQSVLTNPVTGTGAATQVAFWNGTSSITGDNGLWWDNTNKYLGVGTNTPAYPLDVNGAGYINGDLTISSPNYLNLSYVKLGGSVNAFGLDYAIFQATTANTGLAIVAKPNGNPTGFGYDFQFVANQAQNSLLFVGDNATQAHYIHTDAYSTGAGWPLIFGVAAAGQQWLTSSNLLVLTASQNVGIGTTTPSYKLDVNGTFHTVGQNTLTDLAGVGTRMVVADLNGVLSTQTIPSGGGSTRSVNVVSTNTAAGSTSGTDYVYLVSGTTTITLPTAVGNTNLYTIKRVGTGVVSIATTSSETIDGSASPITINVQYVSLDLISDGTNWNII